MENEFKFSYVVILNDGANTYEAEAGFNNITKAVLYADKMASEHGAFNSADSDEVYNSARVAHFEVVRIFGNEHDDEWETVYRTTSFYNE